MEFQKNTDKLSFGFGTMRTAGSGNLSELHSEVQSVHSKEKIAKTASIAALTAALLIIKAKGKHK